MDLTLMCAIEHHKILGQTIAHAKGCVEFYLDFAKVDFPIDYPSAIIDPNIEEFPEEEEEEEEINWDTIEIIRPIKKQRV